MKYMIPFLALLLFALVSCNKDNEEKIKEVYDCEFVQVDENNDGLIDDQEKELMQYCTDEAYDDKNEIKDNLIGEWILVGHGEGWLPTISQPCSYIIFEADELTFKFENSSVDKVTTIDWDIKENQTPSWSTFELDVEDETLSGLGLNVFSFEYMYGNAMPYDGNMYLYKKVK